jgi:hypothetical protein
MSLETRDAIMLAISLLAAAASATLYVPAVLNRAWAAVWSFGISLLVFGIVAVVLFALALGGRMTLQRPVLYFRSGELVVRCLYRTQDGHNPGTKARAREVQELARTGLAEASEALEGRVECVGASGYTTREDVLLAAASSDAEMPVKGA